MDLIAKIKDALKEHNRITVLATRENFHELVHELQDHDIKWGGNQIADDIDITTYSSEHDPPGVNIIRHSGDPYYWFLDPGHKIQDCCIDYSETISIVIDSNDIIKLLGGAEHE